MSGVAPTPAAPRADAPPGTRATAGLEIVRLSGPGFGPVSLRLGESRCLAVTGPSGAGKSRLLRAVADLDPHDGMVRLDGVPAERVPPSQWRRRVALLAAESRWWRDRVHEHFPSRPSAEALRGLALDTAVLDEAVSRLSSGQRQRLALLRLLANEPRVLLLDEPTANLDVDNSRRVERLIANYLAENRAMALWVSHDPAQVRRISDDELRLEPGGPQPREEPVP